MTPRRFFYPPVVIEFYHTMTSKRKPHPTALHFSIDGQPGILRASDIATTFKRDGPSSFRGHYLRISSVQDVAPAAYASYLSHSVV